MIAALFDADGTLHTAQFGRELMKYVSRRGGRLRVWKYYASVLPKYLLNKINLANRESLQRAILLNLSGLLKGYSTQEADSAYRWILQRALIPTLRKDTLTRLNEHRANGHVVIIVSGTLLPALELFRDYLNVDGCIGTLPQIVNGYYSGLSLLPAITGADKASKSRELFLVRGMEVDWASSYAYGDSFTDRDMLDLVGHPVAVYPDPKLHALALQKKWEVLGKSK